MFNQAPCKIASRDGARVQAPSQVPLRDGQQSPMRSTDWIKQWTLQESILSGPAQPLQHRKATGWISHLGHNYDPTSFVGKHYAEPLELAKERYRSNECQPLRTISRCPMSQSVSAGAAQWGLPPWRPPLSHAGLRSLTPSNVAHAVGEPPLSATLHKSASGVF
eukprot:gnl/MRDRNA2_/MRDRNA2_94943_c0_seq1.p1 gnl/MRDRNA2_/MRDRNA2_94943_c0~~gnl/MRDRNA2_/MRDRNA2_94943_c0_seq1.p1  ORF type:complete len:164 (-),score=23.03 gnl/MRDRNA2_/MRDRNA2_94943_c0_seq1:82-573(-)